LGGRRPRRAGRPPRIHRHGPGVDGEHQDKYGYSPPSTASCWAASATPAAASPWTPTACFSAATTSAATPPGTSPWRTPIFGRGHSRRRRLRPLLHPLLGKREEPAVLSRLRRAGRQPHGEERPRLEPLSPARLQRHRGPVPRPRPRALPRRDPAVVRLDGPLPPRLLPPRVQLHDDARGDNFFWWVELASMPPRALVNPADWPPPRNLQPIQVRANVTAGNNLSISTGAGRATVWLAPGMLDFKRSLNVLVNGRKMNNRSSNLARIWTRCWKTSAPAGTGSIRFGSSSSARPAGSLGGSGQAFSGPLGEKWPLSRLAAGSGGHGAEGPKGRLNPRYGPLHAAAVENPEKPVQIVAVLGAIGHNSRGLCGGAQRSGASLPSFRRA